MKTEAAGENAKLKFVLAAIDDMNEYGMSNLSMRRVAERCGLSSGAAYRHFRDKIDLSLAVYRHINEQWLDIANDTVAVSGTDLRSKIEDVSIAYVRFLCEHPQYQSIVMTNDVSMTDEQRNEKGKITAFSDDLVRKYASSVNMDDKTRIRKTFAVRAFIYTGALTVNSGEMPYNDETLNMVRECISREFDLP